MLNLNIGIYWKYSLKINPILLATCFQLHTTLLHDKWIIVSSVDLLTFLSDLNRFILITAPSQLIKLITAKTIDFAWLYQHQRMIITTLHIFHF